MDKKKPIKFKVVKPKPKMEEKKKKFKVVKIADRKLEALKNKAEEQTKKDGIKRRVLPTGEVQRKKTKPQPKPAPKKKIRLKENAVEHEAFGGANIKEAIKNHGIDGTVMMLMDMFKNPNKFIKGYREYSEAEKKRIKKNLKESITKDTNRYKEFADKFKVKEPEFFKYMENHFKDIERPKSEAEFIVGKTKEEINKMDPAILFGKLPALAKLKVLDPKTTGIKVGMTPPLPLDLAKRLDNVVSDIRNLEGFMRYFAGWTFYEGGNFKQAANDYFQKKLDQLYKHSYDEFISDLFEKYKKLPAVIKSTIRQYNMNSYSDSIDYLIERGEAPKYNEEWKYNDDYDDYNVEYRYGLIWDDGDYYTTKQTKSTVNELVRDVNNESKAEKKQAKEVAKEIEKFMKENKLS